MKSDLEHRDRLFGLLRALDEPARAASWAPNDAALLATARQHRLTPLLSIACGRWLQGALAEACRRDRIVTAARSVMLIQAAEQCIRAMQAQGVPVIVLKGLDYGVRLYDQPGARAMADVDLLVPEAYRRTAFDILNRLGFEPRAAAPGFDDPDYHEVAWTRGGVEVDLHMALAPVVRCQIDYQAVWAESVPLRLGETGVRVLSLPHAIVFQALHMAIDHFQVPAIYLVDLAKLWGHGIDARQLDAVANAWRCRRPLQTALALTEAFLPRRIGTAVSAADDRLSRRVVAWYGDGRPVPRVEQLFRKFAHFDHVRDAARYFVVQARRNLHEQVERRVRKRGARERLNLESPVP